MKNHHHNHPIRPPALAEPTHDDIAVCAYTIWIDQGCPENRAELIWLEAEQQLNARKS